MSLLRRRMIQSTGNWYELNPNEATFNGITVEKIDYNTIHIKGISDRPVYGTIFTGVIKNDGKLVVKPKASGEKIYGSLIVILSDESSKIITIRGTIEVENSLDIIGLTLYISRDTEVDFYYTVEIEKQS